MPTTWILVANAGKAKILSQASPTDRLEDIEDMVNTAVRVQTAELVDDEIGQRAASKSRHGSGSVTQPSGYEPNQAPEEHQTELFARNINGFLLDAFQAGRFQKLALIASPEFLGLLRQRLDPHLTAAIAIEINKDYTHLDHRKLQETLQSHLHPS